MSHNAPRTRPPASAVAQTLAAGRLGVWPVVFIVMAAAAPLTVIAGGATTGWLVTGVVGIPIGYLVVAVVLAIFSIGYVAMSRQVLNSGAFYTYVTHGLGRIPGIGASAVALLAYNAMQIGLYGGFGAVTANFVAEEFGVTVSWAVWALAAWALVGVLGVRRIDLNGRILATLLIAEIAVALVLAAVHLGHPAEGGIDLTAISPGQLATAGIGAVLVTAITGFVGFEGTAVFSEESKDPQRTVARATYIALGIIGGLYSLCALAMTITVGPDKIIAAATEHGTELIFVLAAPYVPNWVIVLGHLLFISSLFAALLAFHATASRYFFALGREGVLPRALARTSVRSRSPKAASLTQSVIALVVLGLYAANGWDPMINLFFWITVTGGLGVLILMFITSIAVIGYFVKPAHRADVGVGRGLVAPTVASVALGWILVVTLQQFDVLLGVDPASPWRWIFPVAFGAAAVLGMLWAVYLRTARPQVYRVIGTGAHSALIDPLPDTPSPVTAAR
ncbi:APC family permease [Actinoplanes utahensis]|uniref:Amino acid permease n=1 Tax=Actinoplanes utahensis TaxID=1869 RepID=A0A0A6X0P0_ACTUT|nr:APC family permease [Actinoplanes utahensis]KHD73587.1 amino acid permease [Actinoplanes utahensis]GIF33947.1 amino acid permease [Actinoplanes utahensis]